MSHDGVILLGFMAPLRGLFESHGRPLRDAAELALDEIETLANGVPGAQPSLPRQHLAMLVCHDAPDGARTLERPERVARHLAHTARVPAIIGPSNSQGDGFDVIDVTSPAGVLTLSPSATHPAIPDLENEGLFWRTAPSDNGYGRIWQALALLVSQTLRINGTIGADELPLVAYVARTDSYGGSLSQLVLGHIRLERAPGWTYDLRRPVAWEAMANQIVQQAPLVLFVFSTTEFVTELLPRIEQRWDATKRRPYYMLFAGTRVDELLARVSETPELGARMLLTAPGARNSALFPTFRDRFRGAFGRDQPGNLAEFAYDAAYLLAYAVASTGKQRPSGVELKAALQAMSCRNGTALAADPLAFPTDARGASELDCVNFEGTSGPLDFDGARGEAAASYGLWCPTPAEFRPLQNRASSNLYFDIEGDLLGLEENEALPLCSATK